MHVQYNSLSDYAESLSLITFVVFRPEGIENASQHRLNKSASTIEAIDK